MTVDIEKLEVWRTTTISPDYQVSSFGRVRSLDRKRLVFRKNGTQHLQSFRGKNIILQRNHDGYMMLRVDGKAISAHRLVALVFCEGWEEGLQVNHKNGIKDDNRPDNLEWVTNSENVSHAFRDLGRVHPGLGKLNGTHPSCKKVVSTCLKTGRRDTYPSMTSAADAGFLVGAVSLCCAGLQKKHRGFSWAYCGESKNG